MKPGTWTAQNRWHKFRFITMPQLGPTTFFVSIMLTIQCFKVFDQILMLTPGRAGNLDAGARICHLQQSIHFMGSRICKCDSACSVRNSADHHHHPVPRGEDNLMINAKSQNISKPLLYFTLIAFSVIMLVPFVWMLSASVKLDKDVFRFPIDWIPKDPRWQNYQDIFIKIPLGTFIPEYDKDHFDRNLSSASHIELRSVCIRQTRFQIQKPRSFSRISPRSQCPGKYTWFRNSC